MGDLSWANFTEIRNLRQGPILRSINPQRRGEAGA